jgi:hypothetical protein
LGYNTHVPGNVIMKLFVIDILNKQKCLIYKTEDRKAKISSAWGLVPVLRGYKERV